MIAYHFLVVLALLELKLSQLALGYDTSSLCLPYCHTPWIDFPWTAPAHSLYSDCKRGLFKRHCREKAVLSLAGCSLPCSKWSRQPSNILLDADAGWTRKRFGTNKVSVGTQTWQMAGWWPMYPFKVVILFPLKNWSWRLSFELINFTLLVHAYAKALCWAHQLLKNEWFSSDSSLAFLHNYKSYHYRLRKSYMSYKCG